MLQLVSSSGLIPHCTTPFPKMKGLITWKFTTRSLIAIFCIHFLGKVYDNDIFLTAPNEPSLYCIADVVFVIAEEAFGIGQRPLGFVHDQISFSTRPLGFTPPYELG